MIDESAALEVLEVTTYRAQTAALNKKLEIIRDWLSDSYTAFSTAELMASEKVALYIDQAPLKFGFQPRRGRSVWRCGRQALR